MDLTSKEWWSKHWPTVAAAGAVLLGLLLYVRARSGAQPITTGGGLSAQQAAQQNAQLQAAGLAAQVQEDALSTQQAEQKVAADLALQQEIVRAQTQREANQLAAALASSKIGAESSAVSGALANQRNANTLKFLGESIIPAIQRYLPMPSPAGGSLVGPGSTGGLSPASDFSVYAPTAEEAASIGAAVPIPADVATATGGFAGF